MRSLRVLLDHHEASDKVILFYLICSKWLNNLIQRAVQDGCIEGFSLCRNGPKLVHLFFANDSLFFCRDNMGDIQTIKEIID